MRYLLPADQASEISGRQSYLYDIFHMYFLPIESEGGYITLIPVGYNDPDLLFITGHANQVETYLQSHIDTISETTVVATTCFARNLKRFKRGKTIYVPNTPNPYCYKRDGKAYGFDFDPSDAELNMYNSKGDIYEKIKSSYKLL